jgi:hypothetical protein
VSSFLQYILFNNSTTDDDVSIWSLNVMFVHTQKCKSYDCMPLHYLCIRLYTRHNFSPCCFPLVDPTSGHKQTAVLSASIINPSLVD